MILANFFFILQTIILDMLMRPLLSYKGLISTDMRYARISYRMIHFQ